MVVNYKTMDPKKTEDDISDSIRHRVYFAARDGMPLTLYDLLNEKTTEEIDDLLNQAVSMDGVCCTPLVAAARHGHEGAVRILVEQFLPPLRLETESTVRFEEYVISGATALWAAAGAGHLRIVKRLAQAGAELDHATSTASTPLRAACFDGRLDIVRYLVRRKADLHRPNQYNNTCLMIAAYKGHLDVVSFLLSEGAKVNEKAHCGATALHFAAECGHVSVVKELLDHGAQLTPNENGMTALMCAAERTRAGVVELLVEQPEVSREDAVLAMELLGASFANDKEYYCLPLAYQYMRRSMDMRQEGPGRPLLPRQPSPPIPAYNNWRECTSLEELEAIQEDAAALHMEGLTIRERILGRSCPELPHPVVFRGAVFADDARFDRCLKLWGHALMLRQENKVPVVKDLLRFAQVFSQMIHIGIELTLEQVWTVLDACSVELNRNREKIENPGPKDDRDNLIEEYESNIRTALYLIAIIGRLLRHASDSSESGEGGAGGHCGEDSEDWGRAHAAVFRAARLEAKQRDGQTLLHLALNPNTPVDDFHTNDVCKFPCYTTTKLLLSCGANPNSQDRARETPLHYAARVTSTAPLCNGSAAPPADSPAEPAWVLLQYGAHADTVNNRGMAALDYAVPGSIVEGMLRRLLPNRLCCLSAQVISHHNFSYQGMVPADLHSFIKLHGHKG